MIQKLIYLYVRINFENLFFKKKKKFKKKIKKLKYTKIIFIKKKNSPIWGIFFLGSYQNCIGKAFCLVNLVIFWVFF